MEMLGHVLFLAGIMMAFLAAMLGFFLLSALRGGRLATASMLEALGLIILAINVFLLYTGAITGQFDLLHPTVFWPASGALTLLGFSFVAGAKWQMMKRVV